MPNGTRSGGTALIVNGDSQMQEIGSIVLREYDLLVDQVRSGEEAIDLLCACGGDVAVVLSDAEAPGAMDGVALAHRVSVLWPAISIIISSDRPRAELGELPPGAAVVSKPLRALNLVEVTERVSRADHSVHAIEL